MSPETLRRERKKLGWTQDELARRLGVTVFTVRSWEQGQRGMPALKARQVRNGDFLSDDFSGCTHCRRPW